VNATGAKILLSTLEGVDGDEGDDDDRFGEQNRAAQRDQGLLDGRLGRLGTGSTVRPLFALTTVRPMSSLRSNMPMPHTTNASSPRRTKPPPVLALAFASAWRIWSSMTP
jgi:hypothetical protein